MFIRLASEERVFLQPTHIYTHPLHNNEKQRYYQEPTRKKEGCLICRRGREKERKRKKMRALCLKRRKERKKREHMTMGQSTFTARWKNSKKERILKEKRTSISSLPIEL